MPSVIDNDTKLKIGKTGSEPNTKKESSQTNDKTKTSNAQMPTLLAVCISYPVDSKLIICHVLVRIRQEEARDL